MKTRHGDANDVKIIVPGWNCIDNACHHKHAGPKTCFYTSKLKTTYCIVQSVGRYEQIVKRRAVRRIVHFFQHCAIIVPCNWRKSIFHGLYTRTNISLQNDDWFSVSVWQKRFVAYRKITYLHIHFVGEFDVSWRQYYLQNAFVTQTRRKWLILMSHFAKL